MSRVVGAGMLAAYLILLNVAATQGIAHFYAYHPALGAPLTGHFYAPWEWLYWQQRYYASEKHFYNAVYGAFLILMALGFGGYSVASGFRHRSSRRYVELHGTAHWATPVEIRATGLLPRKGARGEGVYVGGWKDSRGRLNYLRHSGPEHIGVIAPTRSGKGVGLVIPTLLSYPHSVLMNDMKGELHALTAGWRSTQGRNDVMAYNPAARTGGMSINPFAEIRLGTEHEVGDVQNNVMGIVDPDGKGLLDHWAKTAHAFLTGCLLHLLYRDQREHRITSLYDLAFALSDPDRPVHRLYEAMLKNQDAPEGLYGPSAVHPVVAASGRDMLDRPEDERGSVLSTAKSFLTLFLDPIVRRNTSNSDFRVRDLMNGDQPMSLYLIVSAEDKDRMRPLMRIIINQIVRVLLRPELKFENGKPQSPHRHPLLLMLDEFPSFGKLDVFQESMAVIAGYGIKCYLIMQDIAQLWAVYGRHQTILSHLHIRIAFAPNNIDTAEWLSRSTGVSTVVNEHISTSGPRFAVLPMQQVSRDFHESSRPLMTVDEVLRLKGPLKDGQGNIVEPGEILVFVTGHAPIRGTQTLYFRDPVFLARARLPPPNSATSAPVIAPVPEFVL